MSFSLIPQVYAQCDSGEAGVNLSDCLSLGEGKGTVGETYDSPAVLVDLLVRNIFVLAGVVLFILIIYGGFKFISGSVKGKDEALQIWQTAGIGFIVMFSAYWIVQIIKLITGAEIPF